jgi:glycosyltransferase involved in cell wall biosynthesis
MMPYEQKIEGSGGGNSADIASPMKMFEYMAAGRAIISSDLPVIHEVLDAATAVFCPPQEFASWKEALMDLKNNEEKRIELGKAARSYSQAFTWKNRAIKALDRF